MVLITGFTGVAKARSQGDDGRDMVRKRASLFGILISALALLVTVACGGNSTTGAPESTVPSPAAGASASSDTRAGTPPAGTATTEGPTATQAGGRADSRAEPDGKVAVATTSNIVADWVRIVGQDRVDVFPLLPANADPHTYQPGAQDITRIADADLVFSVGLSLEGGWLEELIENAARDQSAVVALGDVVDPIDFVEIVEEHGEEEAEGRGHEELDPHFWFDPLRVKQAVKSISSWLSTTDPAGQTFYRGNATAYNRELDGLHAWIDEQVGSLPQERRVLVTSHDSFQYFALRYGFEVAGAIFPVNTDAEPTAQELGEIIETIEREGVLAVFTERSHSERLARRVTEETGATLIGGLYTGSLGDRVGEAGTYIDLMRHNTTTIVEALR
jgi:ABC-type Zn uptake system ZnuABC Zn-binding protein ZnuA